MYYEAIGIIGTTLILAGFLFSNEQKIRFFNMAGSVLFLVYGVLIGAYSTVLLNSILIVVHIVKLIRIRRSEKACQEEAKTS